MGKYTAEAIALLHNRPGFAREVARQAGFTHLGEVRTAPVLRPFGLTHAQANLLEFIRAYYDEAGVMPSFEEMKRGIGSASKSAVHRLVCALEERGHLMRMPNRARAIFLVAA